MGKITYYANFRANGNTSCSQPITGTNKKRLIQAIRRIAEGNRYKNSECYWSVWIEFNAPYRAIKTIARGGMRKNGTRYRIYRPC